MLDSKVRPYGQNERSHMLQPAEGRGTAAPLQEEIIFGDLYEVI
jgi:hypothetical protein